MIVIIISTLNFNFKLIGQAQINKLANIAFANKDVSTSKKLLAELLKDQIDEENKKKEEEDKLTPECIEAREQKRKEKKDKTAATRLLNKERKALAARQLEHNDVEIGSTALLGTSTCDANVDIAVIAGNEEFEESIHSDSSSTDSVEEKKILDSHFTNQSNQTSSKKKIRKLVTTKVRKQLVSQMTLANARRSKAVTSSVSSTTVETLSNNVADLTEAQRKFDTGYFLELNINVNTPVQIGSFVTVKVMLILFFTSCISYLKLVYLLCALGNV